MFKKIIIPIITLFLLINSCSNSEKPALSDEKFIAVLEDMLITDGVLALNKLEKKFKKNDTVSVYNLVFKKHNVNRYDFEKTIKYYTNNPKEYSELYDIILKDLNKLKKTIKDKKEDIREQGNLWPLKYAWNLPEDGKMNPISFSIEVKEQGTYKLSADLKLYRDDKSINQRMTIVAHYFDGTRDSNTNGTIVKDEEFNNYKVEIVTDKNKKLTKITGWILDHSKGTKSKHSEVKNIKLIYKK